MNLIRSCVRLVNIVRDHNSSIDDDSVLSDFRQVAVVEATCYLYVYVCENIEHEEINERKIYVGTGVSLWFILINIIDTNNRCKKHKMKK